MSEYLNGQKRSKMCGEISKKDISKVVTVMGFVAKYRNLGNLIFIDVRDRTGIVQVSFKSELECFEKAKQLRNEFVVVCSGVVESRGENVNKNIKTGEIEIIGTDLTILSEAETTPFEIKDDVNAQERLRLKYRYLDLRRPILQSNIIMRDKIMYATREYMYKNKFLDIETPFLGKSTPEGARDYLVPSRIHSGKFYALPQSPQLYKQLLMIAGYDRYYQIARCFRDEDLRANRQPEFTQIDIELSYVEKPKDVMKIAEGLLKHIFKKCLGIKLKTPFRKITYKEAIDTYGSDKPDTRYDLKFCNLNKIFKDTEFKIFKDVIKNKGDVVAFNLNVLDHDLTRKEIDSYVTYAKSCGLKGLAWAMIRQDGTESSSFLKFVSDTEKEEFYQAVNMQKGNLVFIASDFNGHLAKEALGQLRVKVATDFKLADENEYDILWVVDFPLFEYDEEEQRYVAVHHPFTSPDQKDLKYLDTKPLKVKANAYDIVINGQEAGGGSIRIHDQDLQKKIFNILGLSKEDIENRFGFFVEAFKYGVPPHGGLAFGLDRLVMLLTKTDNIKDVIAFPKVQNASCLMTEAPSVVDKKQIDELSLEIKNEHP